MARLGPEVIEEGWLGEYEPPLLLVSCPHCGAVLDTEYRVRAGPRAFDDLQAKTCCRCWRGFTYRARDTFNGPGGASFADLLFRSVA